MSEERIYRIIRFRANGNNRTIKRNVTLEQAQTHCSNPKTRGVRAGVRWFDGYEYMPGCKPDSE